MAHQGVIAAGAAMGGGLKRKPRCILQNVCHLPTPTFVCMGTQLAKSTMVPTKTMSRNVMTTTLSMTGSTRLSYGPSAFALRKWHCRADGWRGDQGRGACVWRGGTPNGPNPDGAHVARRPLQSARSMPPTLRHRPLSTPRTPCVSTSHTIHPQRGTHSSMSPRLRKLDAA